MIAAFVIDYDAIASRALEDRPAYHWPASLELYQPRMTADLSSSIPDQGPRLLTPDEERLVLASLRSSSELMYSF